MRPVSVKGWPWLGAPLALDLANTVIDGERELLDGEAALREWLERESGRLPRVAPELDRFLRLRDAVLEALRAKAAGAEPPPRAIAAINAASVAAGPPVLRQGRVVPADGTPTDRALAAIARSAIELLAGDDDVRVCGAPSCGMLYLGRPGQDWCSVPCGNRARAARHYARRRARGS